MLLLEKVDSLVVKAFMEVAFLGVVLDCMEHPGLIQDFLVAKGSMDILDFLELILGELEFMDHGEIRDFLEEKASMEVPIHGEVFMELKVDSMAKDFGNFYPN
jgi:hypothetical protein